VDTLKRKDPNVFDEFTEFDIDVSDTTIHGRMGGAGPPLLLLHGIPETHMMWRRVAPMLAERHTVIATDLRGFGDSGKPPSAEDHSPYSMRMLARDQVETMKALGHDTFGVAGHDRGARCAYRMALDFPSAVSKLAVLDVVPTGDAFDNADMEFCIGYWVWSFLAAPYPVPEVLIGHSPKTIVDYMLDSWSTSPTAFPDDVRAHYVEKFSSPESIHAICEEYRAAATIDYQLDAADKGTRQIECPVLALWDEEGAVEAWYEPLDVWRRWAPEVRGKPIWGGHFLPEENPKEVANELIRFFAS
jgi:haloacetate dehalogenase